MAPRSDKIRAGSKTPEGGFFAAVISFRIRLLVYQTLFTTCNFKVCAAKLAHIWECIAETTFLYRCTGCGEINGQNFGLKLSIAVFMKGETWMVKRSVQRGTNLFFPCNQRRNFRPDESRKAKIQHCLWTSLFGRPFYSLKWIINIVSFIYGNKQRPQYYGYDVSSDRWCLSLIVDSFYDVVLETVAVALRSDFEMWTPIRGHLLRCWTWFRSNCMLDKNSRTRNCAPE